MVKFLEMVAHLKFEEKPNYDKFRQLLRQGLKEGGFPDDGALVFPSMNKNANVTLTKERKILTMATGRELSKWHLIQMPTLGRKFKIGDVYDYNNDTILAGKKMSHNIAS